MTDAILDIRAILPEDFTIQTMTAAYKIPGTLEVEIVIPVEDWRERVGVFVQKIADLQKAKKLEATADKAMAEDAVELAQQGRELARVIIAERQPEVTNEEVKQALPSIEAIYIFMGAILGEYGRFVGPGAVEEANPTPGAAASKAMTPSTRKGRKLAKPKAKTKH